MAEYYPLLAKAVASLPNSTSDSRKVVYERARKALIGQLRTLHPPVPDADIEAESVALDRAIDRLETELAAPDRGVASSPPERSEPVPAVATVATTAPPKPARFPQTGGALGPYAGKPLAPLRTKLPPLKPAKPAPNGAASGLGADSAETAGAVAVAAETLPAPVAPPSLPLTPSLPVTPSLPATSFLAPPALGAEAETSPAIAALVPPTARQAEAGGKPRLETQRPFAPQPPEPPGPKRRLWIIPLGIGIVVVLVALAAYNLRDRPDLLVHKVADPQTGTDASKIVERVGAPSSSGASPTQTGAMATAAAGAAEQQASATPPANPAAPVAGRAALLVEAPDEPNKVKTYLGTVVWRLDNVNGGQNQAVGLAVRADIDLPDDKLKASVIFQKNVDASLPASHTMKVRFSVQPSSATGNVKEINVPQMRREDSATGEALDGVTVPIVENSFLIGLSPGNSENANLELLRAREWIDIPMRLSNMKIAKLTFEKTDVGQRDIQEAITAWAKQ